MRRGATLAVTLTLPRPPSSISATAVGSSPEYTAKDAGAFRISQPARPMSPVASLMPTTPGTWASRSAVSGCMSATVRPGTLYSTSGRSTASAMALKWR